MEAMVALGQSLTISVIIEGLETQQQLETVKHLGCHVGQGYFFARPQPAAQAGTYRRTDPYGIRLESVLAT
ncbi:EAL domain-containing protein [Deinococcus oregonensis]|uniref:EAL domain-containing protein n=1 Tax=Deinococcus oregonensis TaxID=1805970 RepID=A0ABV6B0U2_9DEIO